MILAAATSPSAFWYLTRGSGVVALLLLTASIALGVLTSLGWRSARWPRFLSGGLHRNLTLLAIAFVAVHVVTTVLDGYAPVGLKDAVIPFASRYRPVWVGLGAVAFDLLLALVVTSLLRARIGYRLWRGIHWLAYASWPIALIHALGTGSDAPVGWLTAVGFGSAAIVVLAALARVTLRPGGRLELRLAGAAAALLVPIGIFVWYQSGPGQAGWAKRSGTPAALLASAHTPATATVALPSTSFSAHLNGTIKQTTDGSGLVSIVIGGRLSGGPGGAVRIDLRGQPSGGGVAMSASGVSFVPAGTGTVYTGSVTSLAGQGLDAVVAAGSGETLQLSFALSIDSAGGTVSGTVNGTPTRSA